MHLESMGYRGVFWGDLPILGVWTLDVLALFEVSLQVHGEQRGAGGVVGAADRPVVTAGLVLPAETEGGPVSRYQT